MAFPLILKFLLRCKIYIKGHVPYASCFINIYKGTVSWQHRPRHRADWHQHTWGPLPPTTRHCAQWIDSNTMGLSWPIFVLYTWNYVACAFLCFLPLSVPLWAVSFLWSSFPISLSLSESVSARTEANTWVGHLVRYFKRKTCQLKGFSKLLIPPY